MILECIVGGEDWEEARKECWRVAGVEQGEVRNPDAILTLTGQFKYSVSIVANYSTNTNTGTTTERSIAYQFIISFVSC